MVVSSNVVPVEVLILLVTVGGLPQETAEHEVREIVSNIENMNFKYITYVYK